PRGDQPGVAFPQLARDPAQPDPPRTNLHPRPAELRSHRPGGRPGRAAPDRRARPLAAAELVPARPEQPLAAGRTPDAARPRRRPAARITGRRSGHVRTAVVGLVPAEHAATSSGRRDERHAEPVAAAVTRARRCAAASLAGSPAGPPVAGRRPGGEAVGLV